MMLTHAFLRFASVSFWIKEVSLTETEAKKFVAKLRVYTTSDQYDSSIWILNNFPDLFYIVSPGDHYCSAIWIAIDSYTTYIYNEYGRAVRRATVSFTNYKVTLWCWRDDF